MSGFTGVALPPGPVFIADTMHGWFAQNTDYVLFLILVTGLWLGLGLWLHRTGRFAAVPRMFWLLLLVVMGGGWWTVDRLGRDAQTTIRRQIELLVPYYVQEMQQTGHARLSDSPAPGDPLYEKLLQMEINWLKLNPGIADIYTFRRRADGAIFLLVDSETDYDHNGRIEGDTEQRTAPGEIYDGLTSGLIQAFRGETVFDEEIVQDRWGRWISVFAPLRNSAGAVEAVLGVDFDAGQWIEQRTRARLMGLGALSGIMLLLSAPALLIAILRHDLQHRRKADQLLREQAELRRMIFDQAPGGIGLADMQFRFVEVNDAFCHMLGYRRDELLQLTSVQITHPDDVAPGVAVNQRLANGEFRASQVEKRYIRKDGTVIHVMLNLGLIRDEHSTPKFYVGQVTDITERRQVESELQLRQQQLATILAHAPLVLFAINPQGIYTLAEGAGLSAMGRQPGEAVGHSVYDRYAARPDLLGDIRRALAGETFTVQREINGGIFEARCMPQRDSEGRITGMIGVSIDVTDRVAAVREREKIGHQLLEVQELESLRALARTAAHDFNNLLTAILGNATLARTVLPPASPAAGHLEQAEQAARRATELCERLLTAAGGKPAADRPAPTAATSPATPSARNWRGHGAVLIVDDEPTVRATAAQMIAHYGFTVKQAESGQQAVDFLRQRGSRFDLVLLDLTMPGMDGYATFTALRQLQPDQRIVVFSGYSAQDAKQRFAGQNLNGFLQKPFSADSLREALRSAIEG